METSSHWLSRLTALGVVQTSQLYRGLNRDRDKGRLFRMCNKKDERCKKIAVNLLQIFKVFEM